MKIASGKQLRLRPSLVAGALMVLITAVAFIFRVYQIGKLSLWSDELFSFNTSAGSIQNILQKDLNMSFFHIIAHFWILMLPRVSERSLRTLSVIFSMLSIPVVYLLGKTMGIGKKMPVLIGLMAASMIAFNAYSIQYAQEFRGYSLVFLLSTLSTLLLIKAVERSMENRRFSFCLWIFYVLVSAGAVYTHFYAVFILMAQAGSLIVLLRGDSRTFPFKEVMMSGAGIIFLLAFLPLAVLTRGSSQISWISGLMDKNIRIFPFEITGYQGVPLLILYLLTVFVGLHSGVRIWLQKDYVTKWRFILIAGCLIFPVAMALTVSKLLIPIFLDRYLLIIMPYMSIMAAIGIVTLNTLGQEYVIPRFLYDLTAITLFVLIIALSFLGIRMYFNNAQKEDWRGASGALTVSCSAPTDLRLYYVTWTESYTVYYNPRLITQNEPVEKALNFPDPGNNLIKMIPDKYNKVCLILSENWAPKDQTPPKLIQTALLTKYPIFTRHRFYGVDVEVYNK